MEKSALEIFEELNILDESPRIEAKTAQKQLGKACLETICSFANEPGMQGGFLLLGVTKENEKYIPIGIQNLDQVQREIASVCSSEFNRSLRPVIQIDYIEEKVVIVVYIPEASSHDKPIYIKSRGLPVGAYRRIGSTDQRCSEEDLEFFYQARDHSSFDERVLDEGKIEDLDNDSLELYRFERSRIYADAEELKWENLNLLQSLNCVKKVSDVFKPTVAGMLLFGKIEALKRFFPMARIDYIRVSGTQWISDPERRFESLEIRAPLIRVFLKHLQQFLMICPDLFYLKKANYKRVKLRYFLIVF